MIMIEDVETGRFLMTVVLPVEPNDFRRLGPGWRFDWRVAVEDSEVFKLVDPTESGVVLGLLGLRRHVDHVEVILLESHPRNVGKTKKYKGIPGSLLAFAAQLSFAIGGEGFLAIDAKTELIEHYRDSYGFDRIGRGSRMVLTTANAARLIERHVGRPTS